MCMQVIWKAGRKPAFLTYWRVSDTQVQLPLCTSQNGSGKREACWVSGSITTKHEHEATLFTLLS